MSGTYLQVPTDGAVTEAQAKSIAAKRWRIFRRGEWTGDGQSDGIEWQGSHGARVQRTWAQLNARRQAAPSTARIERELLKYADWLRRVREAGAPCEHGHLACSDSRGGTCSQDWRASMSQAARDITDADQ